ncbi:lytic transglycosylase domain-containing protein [Variovorax sp. PCZ-1]|uniref:lytic transglycosylase domain-containing protein n=1 Tax=Variovorax sp. PCZ-1 TaxID=2835533 RepID=UPI001BCFCAA1|nr:lytic transglycosylase domain-containing protein [Variovorax sp. PCZ-1]MBS7808421.1 lytic transglycosylase domain-containing protein [Variovorax sp. PCZ-1]
MQVFKTFILAGLCSVFLAGAAFSQSQRGDDLIVQMSEASKRGDKARLSSLLPQVRGHVLEPWGVYWEMKARLQEASNAEIQAALQSIAGSYQEDRLRNDWLQLLGQRRDWQSFSSEYAKYRMQDDREVRCYALHIDRLRGAISGEAAAQEVLRNWYGMRDADDGCTLAAGGLLEAKLITALDVWKEARLSIEGNRARAATNAVTLVSPESAGAIGEINANPARYLSARATAAGNTRKELVTLALIKMASNDAEAAAGALESKWSVQLTPEERSWVWAVIGKQANLKLSSDAGEYYAKSRNEHLNDDLLGWKARTALRATSAAQGWPVVLASINAMSEEGKKDNTWVYWKARALRETAKGKPEMVNSTPQSPTPTLVLRPELQEAQNLLESIASVRGFYEILATEELGRKAALPPTPSALSATEKEAARLNPGLNRALYAIALGLRSDGVREWNYTTNLHTRGGMSERELLAAADFACQREVWDRCINTSERTKEAFNADQRFPMPFRDAVVKRSREINLDPAYVYGLIRQESRFIMDARSVVGASGLMQVMPATARWTAKRIGLDGFSIDQLNNRDTNIAIGTAYLKLVLDDFQGSSPLAAAAYNAGPSRPRVWRNGPVMEGAAWAENVPFAETRDYVKKVAANATVYGLILGGQPSLKARMGTIGPREGGSPEPNRDIP